MAEQPLRSAAPAGADALPPPLPGSPRGGWRPGALVAERFRLRRLLGSGSMGEVWSADDLELDETVALKRLRQPASSEGHFAAYFRREVRLARRVSHPNVARVFELVVLPGAGEGRLFLTMEYVRGHTLAELLRRPEPFAPAAVAHLVRAASAGLEAVHAAGVVHRDVKPGNVMVGERGRVVLTDFGVALGAREAGAESGALLGTLAYMAPELFDGAPASAASDLYALGCVAYELLTRRRAFDAGEGLVGLRARKVRRLAVPDAPDVPGLAAIVAACLEPDPAARPASAAALEAELARLGAPALSLAAPARTSSELPAAERHRRKLVVLPFAGAEGVDERLVDLLGDDFAGELSRHKPLYVLPPEAARRRLRDGAPAPAGAAERGRLLGADVVVAGDVRPEPGGLAVALRAVAVGDGRHLWSWAGHITLGERLPSMAAAAHHLLAAESFADSTPPPPDGSAPSAGARATPPPLPKAPSRPTPPPLPPPSGHAARGAAASLPPAPPTERPSFWAATVAVRRADDPEHDTRVPAAPPTRAAPGRVLDAYLRGRALLATSSLDALEAAIGHFEEALALAPEDPRLASALTVALARHLFLSPETSASMAERAERAAEYAVRVAPSMGEAHQARAVVWMHRGAPAAAVHSLRQALRFTPSLVAAHHTMGQLLLEAGLEAEGNQRLAAAQRLEPGNVDALWPLYRFAVLAGRPAEAEAHRRAMYEAEGGMHSRWYLHLRIAAWRGDVAEMERVERSAVGHLASRSLLPPFRAYASVVLRGADPTAAYVTLRRSAGGEAASARTRAFLYQLLAEIAGFVGDEAEAASALVLARDAALIDRPWLEACPLLAGVRHRPEYRGALEGALAHAEAMRQAYFCES